MSRRSKLTLIIGSALALLLAGMILYPLFARPKATSHRFAPKAARDAKRQRELLFAAWKAYEAGDINSARGYIYQVNTEVGDGFVAGDSAHLMFHYKDYGSAIPYYRRALRSVSGSTGDYTARMLACAIAVGDEGAKKEAMARLGTDDPVKALLRGASSMEAMGDGDAMRDLVLRAKALRPNSPEVARMMKRAEMTIREAAENKVRRTAQSAPLP